jgi:hypothetical protein
VEAADLYADIRAPLMLFSKLHFFRAALDS